MNWHISNVFGRLGASSRAEAVALAMRDEQVTGDQVELPRRRTVRRLPLSPVVLAVAVTLVIGLLGGAVLAGWDFTSLTSPLPSVAPSAPTSQPAQQTAAPAGGRTPGPTAQATTPAGDATSRPTSAPLLGSPATPSPLPLSPLGTTTPVLPALSPTNVPIPVGSAPVLPTLPPLPSIRLP